MHFLHKETKSKLRKKIYFIFGKGGGGWRARARVSEFFTKDPNLKKKFFWGEMGLEGGGGGGLELVKNFLLRIQIKK